MLTSYKSAVVGYLVSMGSAAYSWFHIYGSAIATGVAIAAGLYSMRTTYLTNKVRKKELARKHEISKRRHFLFRILS
jgi:hypothetical protein